MTDTPTHAAPNEVSLHILDHAQRMLQTRGYHGFSYADISTEVGIRKASIHYYFPHKDDLAFELVVRYRDRVRQRIACIDAESDTPSERLVSFVHLFRDIVRSGFPHDGGRICLCAALTADLQSLPVRLRDEVRAFFAENETWLSAVLSAGLQTDSLHFESPAMLQAQTLLAGLQGAMLLARVEGDANKYCDVAHGLLAQMGLKIATIR